MTSETKESFVSKTYALLDGIIPIGDISVIITQDIILIYCVIMSLYYNYQNPSVCGFLVQNWLELLSILNLGRTDMFY